MKLSGDLILGTNPLNRVRLLPPNDNPLTKVELDTRSGCRQRVVMWRSCLLQMVLKLTSAGKHMTKTLREAQTEQISNTDLMKPEGDIQTRTLHLVMPWRRLSSGGSGGFKPWWLYWARNWMDPAKLHNSFLRNIVLLYLFIAYCY